MSITKVTYWQCSHCRKEYVGEEEAIDCSAEHVPMKEPITEKMEYYDDPKYPTALVMLFYDGATKRYILEE